LDLSARIEAFAALGDHLRDSLPLPAGNCLSPGTGLEQLFADPSLRKAAEEAYRGNPWFIPLFIHHALSEIGRLLERDNLQEWTGRYPAERFQPERPRVVGTVPAGNIPLAGFHDFLSILVSGNRFRGKLSGKDDKLLPFLADRLIAIEPRFADYVQIEESRLGSIDALIATGSNNSFRYFEYYFGSYPHIFRRNRNGTALLDGKETAGELDALADDVFLYFGMGCRSVAKLYVPPKYDFDAFFRRMERYRPLIEHHKYANNYLYHRSIFLMNRTEHLDNGFLLVRPDLPLSSAVATLHYETWAGPPEPPPGLAEQQESIQCVVGKGVRGFETVGFGRTQHPELWDYADHVDTLNFLLNLS
jgi:hypothetical protein